MKNHKRIFTLSVATAVLTGLTPLFAADSTTPPPPPSAPAHHERGAWHKHGNPLANLTKEERQELKAVTEKTKDDSSVIAAKNDQKEAMKAEREAVKAAVVKADPNAQAIFDSMGKGKAGHKELTQEQREELRTDFEKVKDDSSVKTAREQLKKTHEAYVTAWRAAAVAADSKIQPVLDKLPKNWAPEGRRGMKMRGHHHHKGAAQTSGSSTETTGSASN